MALTLETTSQSGSFVPAGATPPATTITFTGDVIEYKGVTQLEATAIDHATDPLIGFADLITALDTYISGTYVPSVLKLDVAQTINMIVTITGVKRIRSNPDIYLDGTQQYSVNFTVQYQ